METVCISLGGALVSRRNGVNVSYVRRFLQLLKDYRNVYNFVVVVGGGYASRLYITSSRKFIPNQLVLDEIAIAITRINALLVKDLLSELDVYPKIVTSLDELRTASKSSRVVVMGGLLPGMSTDAVTVLACEVTNGKMLINISRESYIHDPPPGAPGSRKIESLTHDQLIALASKYDSRVAGSHFLFDLVASKLAKRANIEIRFVNDDINQLRYAILNKKHMGSHVRN